VGISIEGNAVEETREGNIAFDIKNHHEPVSLLSPVF
jgi:hypothetical protein